MEDVNVTAVCDINPEQLKRSEVKFNIDVDQGGFDVGSCNTYLEFREMLSKEDLDVVVTALPTDLHADYAIRAMEAGCHVFTEKPMALTVEACDRMLEGSARTGKQLMVGQCIRFWPEYEVLEQCFLDGRYGRLRSLSMDRLGEIHNPGSWFNDHSRSGGPTIDMHIHDADWARNVIGKPDEVCSAGIRGVFGGIEDLTSVWRYDDGPIVSFRCTWMNVGQFCMMFRANFEEATLTMPGQSGPGLWVSTWKDRSEQKISVREGSAYFDELRYFLDCVTGKIKNERCAPVTSRDSLAMVATELEIMNAGGGLRRLTSERA